MHEKFVAAVIEKIKADPGCIGLAAGGSWINNQIDEFSDIDLILVTASSISHDFQLMYNYAQGFGNLLNAFTGEHVGEKRLLICIYDDPLVHVDIKFITLEELAFRVEDPVILWDRDGSIAGMINRTKSAWPEFSFQFVEDRFWTWIHYAALKIGRGELFEALDFLSFLRITALAPLMQIKNRQLPRGVRRIEQNFPEKDLEFMKTTIASYSYESVIAAIEQSVDLYRALRLELFPKGVLLRSKTEARCLEYFYQIKARVID
ncbi:MAG: aminoglycoside 6-adenylyltransferase [Candidatus Riflebacteria bacterium]